MVPCQATSTDLPTWQDQAVKTACGKLLPKPRIQVGMDLQLASGQTLCSHVGRRKGFTTIRLD